MACPPYLSEEDLFHFRTKICKRPTDSVLGASSGCRFGSKCQYSHDKEHQRRCPYYLTERMPKKSLRYLPIYCPNLTFKQTTVGGDLVQTLSADQCPREGNCPYAHNSEEILYHPMLYKTRLCPGAGDKATCNNYYCPSIHNASEKRYPSCFYLPYCPQWESNTHSMPCVPGAVALRGGRPSASEISPLPKTVQQYVNILTKQEKTDTLITLSSVNTGATLICVEPHDSCLSIGDGFYVTACNDLDWILGEALSGANKGRRLWAPRDCFLQLPKAMRESISKTISIPSRCFTPTLCKAMTKLHVADDRAVELDNDVNSDDDSTRRNTNSTQSGTETIILRPVVPGAPVQKINSDSSVFIKSLLDAEASLLNRQVKKTLSMPAGSEEADTYIGCPKQEEYINTTTDEHRARSNTTLFDPSRYAALSAGLSDQVCGRDRTSESSSTTADNFQFNLLNDLSLFQVSDAEAGERTISTTFGLDYGKLEYQTGKVAENKQRQDIMNCLQQMQSLAATSGSQRFYMSGALSCLTTALQFLRNSLASIEEESFNLVLSNRGHLHQETILKQKSEYSEIWQIHKMTKQTFDELSVALARETDCSLDFDNSSFGLFQSDVYH